eukprot:GHVU01176422.1.p1 GENE.GHVU01176422.1~~GHVU01176422.1.p1  ORF type:complete len:118 (+),score=0.39 GHVU01176422.1:99-452(+)
MRISNGTEARARGKASQGGSYRLRYFSALTIFEFGGMYGNLLLLLFRLCNISTVEHEKHHRAAAKSRARTNREDPGQRRLAPMVLNKSPRDLRTIPTGAPVQAVPEQFGQRVAFERR